MEAYEVSVIQAGIYDGTAYMGEGGAPVSMTNEEDGDYFRWTANIETPGANEPRRLRLRSCLTIFRA